MPSSLDRLPKVQLDALMGALYDHAEFCRHTSIRNKDGERVQLELSPSQQKLDRSIHAQESRGLPVRQLVLKARQVHFSVGATSELWRRTAFQSGAKARVFCDVYKNTQNLFSYWQQFIEGYHAYLGIKQLRVIRCNTDHMLEFEGGGQVMFESAERASGGRSHAIRYLHNSENAFWRDAATLRTGLLSSVPLEPGTMILDESTANGAAGPFYEHWKRCEDPNNTTGWMAVFFGWWEHPEYQMPLNDPATFERSLTDFENVLRQKYSLKLEQLHWRRWKINTDLDGDVRRFQQEFPSDPSEAFLVSGRTRFDTVLLERHPTCQPNLVGELERVTLGTRTQVQFLAKSDGRGSVRIWKRPELRHNYVIGADSSEGIDATDGKGATPDPDYGVAIVFDGQTGDQVAGVRVRLEPAPFAEMLFDLGEWYNWAFICPEANSSGLGVIERLLQLQYPVKLIYHRKRQADDRRPLLLQDLGWKTTAVNKPQIISDLDRALRNMEIYIRDPLCLGELRTFVYDERGRMGATRGAHDDYVMGAAMGVVGLVNRPTQSDLGVQKHTRETVQRYGSGADSPRYPITRW